MSLPPGMGSDSTARHACHCGKSFVRKEHLTRHQATHDKLAYICNVCQRRFSRNDVLRRHSVLHEASYTPTVVSCDACRANKTKCSGGTQCLLCARRGINCTFRSGLRQSKRATTSDETTAVNASVGENDANDDVESISPRRARSENFLAEGELPTEEELVPPDVEFLKELTIIPSKSAPRSEFKPLGSGVEAIYELLVAEESSLETAMHESDELQDSVTKYLEIYFKSFHPRWPIFHAPTFDIETLSLPLAASVCVIGAWLQSSAIWTERFYALRVHEILLQRLLDNLIDSESMSGEQAWPIELFQAVFITLVFSLYRTDKSVVSRAMLLRSTFITLLRELGAFNAELLAIHLKTYFSGTYTAYTLSMRERFKRLLALTYQIDTYFALAHGKPPILHRHEADVDLPSTFALWNAYGLDIYAKRQSEEPPERSGFQISEMTNNPDSFKSSQLLVEDVQLGLCGLLQAIWVHMHSFPSQKKEYLSNAFRKALLIETLDAWKHELDKINALANARDITSSTAAKYLLLAYRGKDDSVAASLERMTTLVQDAMILYYYLKMYHHAGLNAASEAAVGPMRQMVGDPRTETWRTSKDGREALVCALQMLEMVESIDGTSGGGGGGGGGASLNNPLIRHALIMGINVTRAVVSGQKCGCLDSEGLHAAAAAAANTNIQRWIEIGETIWIDGAPVCVCKLEFWTGKFEKAIQDQKIMAE